MNTREVYQTVRVTIDEVYNRYGRCPVTDIFNNIYDIIGNGQYNDWSTVAKAKHILVRFIQEHKKYDEPIAIDYCYKIVEFFNKNIKTKENE